MNRAVRRFVRGQFHPLAATKREAQHIRREDFSSTKHASAKNGVATNSVRRVQLARSNMAIRNGAEFSKMLP
jgi:hypothetical protein